MVDNIPTGLLDYKEKFEAVNTAVKAMCDHYSELLRVDREEIERLTTRIQELERCNKLFVKENIFLRKDLECKARELSDFHISWFDKLKLKLKKFNLLSHKGL